MSDLVHDMVVWNLVVSPDNRSLFYPPRLHLPEHTDWLVDDWELSHRSDPTIFCCVICDASLRGLLRDRACWGWRVHDTRKT